MWPLIVATVTFWANKLSERGLWLRYHGRVYQIQLSLAAIFYKRIHYLYRHQTQQLQVVDWNAIPWFLTFICFFTLQLETAPNRASAECIFARQYFLFLPFFAHTTLAHPSLPAPAANIPTRTKCNYSLVCLVNKVWTYEAHIIGLTSYAAFVNHWLYVQVNVLVVRYICFPYRIQA